MCTLVSCLICTRSAQQPEENNKLGMPVKEGGSDCIHLYSSIVFTEAGGGLPAQTLRKCPWRGCSLCSALQCVQICLATGDSPAVEHVAHVAAAQERSARLRFAVPCANKHYQRQACQQCRHGSAVATLLPGRRGLQNVRDEHVRFRLRVLFFSKKNTKTKAN